MSEINIDDLPYRQNVGIMLVNASGHVFVAQRLDNNADAWQMPQGGIDAGETPRDAALRELSEETGVTPDLVDIHSQTADWMAYDLPLDMIPQIWGGKYRGQKQKWFRLTFRGTDADINIETEHPEFSQWQWLPASELADRIVPFKRDVYAQVVAELASDLV
jgi:putative (di)nucleoside polyphosphate hydrolase